MLNMRFSFCAAVLLAPSFLLACPSPPQTSVSEQLVRASAIAIVRLESAEFRNVKLGERISMPLLEGRVRVIETLKGPKASFERFTLSAACNDLRLDVGDYYLVATTQQGNELILAVADSSLLNLSPRYQEGRSARSQGNPDLTAVLEFLAGDALPEDFPSHGKYMTDKYHLPPPCDP